MSCVLYTTTNNLHSPRYSCCQCRFMAPFPVSRSWSLAGSTRLVWQCEDAAGTLLEPLFVHLTPAVLTGTMLWTCQGSQPPRPHQTPSPSLHLVFLSRDKKAKQSFLWAFLPLLVPVLLRNICFECKVPLKNVCPSSCNPHGFLGTEI